MLYNENALTYNQIEKYITPSATTPITTYKMSHPYVGIGKLFGSNDSLSFGELKKEIPDNNLEAKTPIPMPFKGKSKPFINLRSHIIPVVDADLLQLENAAEQQYVRYGQDGFA